MKIIRTLEEFKKEIDNSKKIILYGAGWAGRNICRFLQNHAIQVAAFVVTDQKQTDEQERVSVYYLDEIANNNQFKDSLFLLATTRVHRRAMEDELERRGINEYVELTEVLLYEIAEENRKYVAKIAGQKKEKCKGQLIVGYLSPGYCNSDYAERRLIIDKIEKISYLAIPKETQKSAAKGIDYEEKAEKYHQLLEACYCPDYYRPEVALIHTFNTICNTDRPWCVSFETSLPRMSYETEPEREYFLQLVEYMKKTNCKALYALCQNAWKIQKASLMKALTSSDDVELLMNKTKVLHPPQKILITEEEFERKHHAQKIHFIFIGRAFFFKGGREMVQVLSAFERKYNFDLTLISSLQCNDYFTKTSYEEALKYKKIIQESTWIDYYESLPNNEVLKKCKEATIGLLPSVGDTYGYAVLEMQAAGCPVITTNIRAFPEINNEECGWICQLPINELGVCIERDTEVWSEILKKELRRCFQEIFNNPKLIVQKGRKALERIRRMHDPHEYQKELRKNLL